MARPLLIYDGRCGFCRIWIDYWKRLTGDRVDYASSQEVGAQYPQIQPQAFGESVQLVRPDGSSDSIVAAHSLIPEAMRHMMSGLAVLLRPDLPLTRRQQEMIAAVVSAENACFY